MKWVPSWCIKRKQRRPRSSQLETPPKVLRDSNRRAGRGMVTRVPEYL